MNWRSNSVPLSSLKARLSMVLVSSQSRPLIPFGLSGRNGTLSSLLTRVSGLLRIESHGWYSSCQLGRVRTDWIV